MRWLPFAVTMVLLLGCPAPMDPTVGSPCSAQAEGVGRCDALAPRLLQCTNRTYEIFADCKGERGCSITTDTAICDTTGNSVGDRCGPDSEGKVRCDPDGGLNILRCVDGGLTPIFTCMPPSVCGTNDAGLTCI